MALGAQPGDVLRIVLSSTVASIGSGILAGLLMTLILGTILAKWAEGNSWDPLVLLASHFGRDWRHTLSLKILSKMLNVTTEIAQHLTRGASENIGDITEYILKVS
jgi:hypothetical protein